MTWLWSCVQRRSADRVAAGSLIVGLMALLSLALRERPRHYVAAGTGNLLRLYNDELIRLESCAAGSEYLQREFGSDPTLNFTRGYFNMAQHRLLVFVVSAALSASAVMAQSNPPNQPKKAEQAGGLEEVIVTAERREASLQSVPVAVSAINAENLEKLQVTEPRSLERYIPSLRMSNNVTSPTNLSPSMRGSLQQDASLVVAESPFGMYVDDLYLGRLNGNNIALADIERVEVLRGPQGTLYGRNTLAGAVKFITRTPDEESWARASIGAGNYSQNLASVSMGGPLGDNWAASISGMVNNKQGFHRNVVTGERRGEEENRAARFKLHYRGHEKFDAVLSLSYSDSENDAVQLMPFSVPADPMAQRQYTSDEVVLSLGNNSSVATPRQIYRPTIISPQPRGDTEQLISSLTMTYDFGPATFKSITGYVKTDDYFSTDFGGAGVLLGASTPRAEQWSQEFQIQGSALSDRLKYLAGAYVFREDGSQDFGWFFVFPPFNNGISTSQIDAQTDSYSLFGQADYQLTDNVKLTAGGRWTKDKKDFRLDFQYIFIPVPVAPTIKNADFSEFTPKLGIDWQVNPAWADEMLVYLSAARGFKSGGFNGINIFDNSIAQTVYDPESNYTYEVGAKTELLGRRLRVNAAYFFADVSDIAMNSTVLVGGQPAFPVDNQGDAEIQGLELETTFLPIDNLTLFANLALLDGRYTQLEPGSAAANAQTLFLGGKKASPPQLPNYTIAFGFDYGIDLQLGADGSRLKFGADMYRTDDYVTSATADFLVKAYNRINAFVALDYGDSLEARFAVKNLADDQEVYVGSRQLGGVLVLPPREYMFTVTYRQ